MGEITPQTAIIIGAAPGDKLNYLTPYRSPGDVIICADGGRKTAEQAGLTPDYYVGDGDSGGTPDGLPATVLPVEKDWTDLEAAVHHALHLGCRTILLCGCTGGRADHHLANCFLLEQIAQAGAEGLLLDADNEIRFLGPGNFTFENSPAFCYIGIVPVDRELRGVTLRGVKYPVTNETFFRAATRAVSNEFLPGCRAEITIGEGCAFLIRSQPVKG